MVNLIISVVVFCKAITKKVYSFIPVASMIFLYELARRFEAPRVEHAGLVERVLALLLVISVFFAWRKKQLHISANCFAVGVLLLRWGWSPVFHWFQKVMQYPGSDAAALIQQAAMVRSIHDALIMVLILELQILMLWELRKK